MATDPHAPGTRVFPPVSQSLYDEAPQLRAMVRPTRLRDAFSLKTPDATRRFSLIVTAHATAFDAERAGQWDRADFYWSELWSLIAGAGDDDPCWGAAVAAGASSEMAPAALREHFLREIVVGCHAGFFRSQVDAGLRPLDRPRIHLEGIARAHAALPMMDINDEAVLSDSLIDIALGVQDGTAVEDVMFLFAHHFQRQTQYLRSGIAQFHARVMAQLEQSKGMAKRSAIESAIARVVDLRDRFPVELVCYQVLGILYHEQTIVLAEAGDISGALLASRKAEAFGADPAVVADTLQQLTNIMSLMQSQAAQLKEQLRGMPGGELTEKGRQLVAQAAAGNTTAAAWAMSRDAREIRTALERARGIPARVSPGAVMALPSITLQSTTKAKSHERMSDMIAGANSRRLRLQLAAAALFVALAAGSVARTEWVDYRHAQALDKVRQARAANDDEATLRALGELFSATTPRGDQSLTALAPLYSDTLARWLTTKIDGLTPADRRVLAQYKELVVSRGLDSMEVQP